MTQRENLLFQILIITLIGSGLVLIILKFVGDYYREQVYLATEATLPIHKTASSTQPTEK